MPGAQVEQIHQRASGIPGPVSSGTSADSKSNTQNMAENRQKRFWQDALASNSILLWIVTNIRATDDSATKK